MLWLVICFSLFFSLCGTSKAVDQENDHLTHECVTIIDKKIEAEELPQRNLKEINSSCSDTPSGKGPSASNCDTGKQLEDCIDKSNDRQFKKTSPSSNGISGTKASATTDTSPSHIIKSISPGYTPASAVLSSEKIKISAYEFLSATGSETPGYGLYSYVILRKHSTRNRALLEKISTKVKNADNVLENPSNTNIIYIPTHRGTTGRGKAGQNLNNFFEDPANIQSFLSLNSKITPRYNFNISKELIDAICKTRNNEVESLCSGDEHSGPYLITYSNKIGTTRPLPPPYLLVDLTPIDESAFDTLLSSYLDQIKTEKFDDRSKIDTFSNKLLTLILRAAHSLKPISAATLGVVHLVKTADAKDPSN